MRSDGRVVVRLPAAIWWRRYGGRVFVVLAAAALAVWPLDVGLSVGLLFLVMLAAGIAAVTGWALLAIPAVVALAALDDAFVDGLVLAALLAGAYLLGRLFRWALDRASGARLD